ncbi:MULTISPECIES: SpoIIE family protein phosphatase [Flammeovirga]|uniref:SpoIIE family protein phosphatase n=1 Tax=Flammeovirga agarivorans TaxID=2726742 RepID=A0A7X8SM06_9BACT|nr:MULTISPECIES: SpoIIE family protein phosphatase [Flammeovirga]NLR92635.1 SpoIIE family protein phosphatase [Flammeovirga agarivorans]
MLIRRIDLKYLSIILCIFLFSKSVLADSELDSAQYKYLDTSTKNTVDFYLEAGELDSMKILMDSLYQKIGEEKFNTDAYWLFSRYCFYFEYAGELDSAEYYCKKSLEIAEKEFDLKQISISNVNLATLYINQGRTETAMNLLKLAYEIDYQLDDKVDLAFTMNNIGYVYLQHKEYVQAFEVFEQILDIELDSTNEDLDHIKNTALLNIADVHVAFEEYTDLRKVLQQLDKNGNFRKENNFEGFILLSLLKGKLAMGMKDYPLAKKIFLISVRESNKKQLPIPKLNSYLELGNYHYELKEYSRAYDAFEKAYIITKQNRMLDREYEVSLKLAQTLRFVNKDQAIYFYEKSTVLSDSLFNKQKLAAVADMQAFHEVEQQKTENDVLREIEYINQIKLQENKNFLRLTVIIVMLLLVFIYYIFLSQRKTKKLNTKLSSINSELGIAKLEMETMNEELIAKNDILKDTLEHSKEQGTQLNYQNNKINSSIKSALLIQSSILISKDVIDNAFEKNFIFNQPKDIVSGDFYWFFEKDGWKIYACVDCTGHGVPGALMSMMGSSLLYEIVRGNKIYSPSEILKELNNLVVRNLQQEYNDNNDGMDMSIIAVKDDHLYFSGAKNPLYIVRNGELTKLPGTRKSIGGEMNHVYDEHTWEIQKDDMVYMATDGYQDQFGGVRARKFMVGKLRRLLEKIAKESPSKQHDILQSTINSWMAEANWEQIDDMMILGVKL